MAKVTTPDGVTETIPLDWNGAAEGTYQAELNATRPGSTKSKSRRRRDLKTWVPITPRSRFRTGPSSFPTPSLDARLLQSVASSTGGRYYPLSKLGDVRGCAVRRRRNLIIEQKELWDVPFLFMLLCLSFGGEWFWRKKKGLA